MKKFVLMLAFAAMAFSTTFAQDRQHSDQKSSHHRHHRRHHHTDHRN